MPVIDSKKSFVIFIVVAIALVALGNLVSRNFFFRLDLTENQIYSLSPSSKVILEKIEDFLTAKVYFSENFARAIRQYAAVFAGYSGRICRVF